jgi:hypothetical protein|uniref:Uncharacterized protein n=1 Tax=Mimiviridae sp. ChoanoV1 TaxID=2596887 RepID=A0A5B8IHU0_9VIRU|nr:hypothetical protein 3_74 [Mimiviridae sp. ChoanoV1]
MPINEDEVEKLLSKRFKINKDINKLKKELTNLEREKKKLNKQIYDNCNHNWIYDYKYFTYDDRPQICTICRFVK